MGAAVEFVVGFGQEAKAYCGTHGIYLHSCWLPEDVLISCDSSMRRSARRERSFSFLDSSSVVHPRNAAREFASLSWRCKSLISASSSARMRLEGIWGDASEKTLIR